MQNFLRSEFQLPQEFINKYSSGNETLGFNGVGLITFLRSYALQKDSGKMETWRDCCQRVIEQMYAIQKWHCKKHNLNWNSTKALYSAKEAFDRMFNLKWLPPGRGLATMGTNLVSEVRGVESLQSCAFLSFNNFNTGLFGWAMTQSMLGVGVGFDTKSLSEIKVSTPKWYDSYFEIQDTRESWAESVVRLLNCYINDGESASMYFDYDNIRPKGSNISTFNRPASGPEPLKKLHANIKKLCDSYINKSIDSRFITDVMNMIGACVVSGSVRRSAEIALGDIDDDQFLDLKDYTKFPERVEFGWNSNNSVVLDEYQDDYSDIVSRFMNNGEPGIVWRNNFKYGRMEHDIQHDNALGVNPCSEMTLAHKESCTLSELMLNNHDTFYDFRRSIKFAYLYSKTITLLSQFIKDDDQRNIMINNRRIGLSMTGIAQFIENNSIDKLVEFSQRGYAEVKRYDDVYSDWLNINRSIKLTTVKPSGSISLLPGSTPGMHYPISEYYIRRVQINEDSNILPMLEEAGYHIEKSVYADYTKVVSIPVFSGVTGVSYKHSAWQQLELAALLQQYWSDNSVSVTVTIPKETTSDELNLALQMYQTRLKSVSFLPELSNVEYQQMPYETIAIEEYFRMVNHLKPLNHSLVKNTHEVDDLYCSNDSCEIDLSK